MDSVNMERLLESAPLLELSLGGVLLLALLVLRLARRGRKTTSKVIAPQTKKRLGKTAGKLFGELRRSLSSGKRERDELFKILESALIMGDLGVNTAEALIQKLKENLPTGEITLQALEQELKSQMSALFNEQDGADLKHSNGLTVVVLVGVNGVGKTTTAGKLADRLGKEGKKVVLAACDTFRAAAPEQLKIWAERSGAEIVFGSEGMKPATVAFQALSKAKSSNADLLLIDTAGRLHTKNNLMQELEGVLSIITREMPGAPHETLLVVDATSGQNALEQARVFNQATPLSGLVITKLDGTPKGGMLFAIRKQLGIPVRFIGLGEKAEELELFSKERFLDELFSSEVELEEPIEPQVRRKRREG